MKTITLDVPAMYADHHVTEVRRILLDIPGVQEVIASSAFMAVEITFDGAQIDEPALRDALDAAGYLRPLDTAAETGQPEDNRTFPRHSAAIPQVGKTVSFAQDIPSPGLHALSCPGIGVLRMED